MLVLAFLVLGDATGSAAAPSADELRVALGTARGPRRLALLNQLAALTVESSPAEAIRLTEEALPLARAAGDPGAEGEALIAQATARRARGEYLLGADAGRTALVLAGRTADRALAARAHNVLGLIDASAGEPAAALRHALEEQALYERLSDPRGLSQAYNNVGNSLRRLGEYDRAIEFHRRSLALKTEQGDHNGAGYSHHNMGEAQLDSGAPERALESFREAERAWRAVDNARALPAAVKSQGDALVALGRPAEALERLRSSLALRRENPRGEAETLMSLGALLLQMKRPGEAATAYRGAASLARRLGHDALTVDVLGGLAKAEEALGERDAAGRARVEEVALLKRLRDQERARERADMRAALEARETQSRAERLESEAALREQELGRRRAERNLALAGAAFLLAVTLTALAAYRTKYASEMRLREQATRLEEALAQVKTLRGLLPLCAWCKKVRADDGYWKDLLVHVQEQTEAEISHGICPDCQAAHFPRSVPATPRA